MREILKQAILCTATLTLCTACNAGSQQKPLLSVKTESSSTEEADSASPVGYWTQEHTYPVFSGQDSNTETAIQLNRTLTNLMEQYSCPTGGDKSFEAKVETLERRLVSVSYVAMWTCSTMPSPDSTEGALNLTLPSMEKLELQPQFSSKERYRAFSDKVRTLYNEQIGKAGNNSECLSTKWDFFTVTSNAIVLHFDKTAHSPSNCELEIMLPRSELNGQLSADSPLLP